MTMNTRPDNATKGPSQELLLCEVRRALAATDVEDRDQVTAEVERRLASRREFPSIWPHRTAEVVRWAVGACFADRADAILAAVFMRDFRGRASVLLRHVHREP